MAIHVQDEETDWLVRDFARRRGVGITAAIRLAVQEATQLEGRDVEAFLQRIRPILEKVRAQKAPGDWNDKAFMDEMWGEED